MARGHLSFDMYTRYLNVAFNLKKTECCREKLRHTSLPSLPAQTDVVKLASLQRRAKHMKKQKVVQVQVDTLVELKQFMLDYNMPESISIATLQ